MSNDQLKQLAAELKAAREENNITLQMLHQKTRIDIKFLEAVETGNFPNIDEVYLLAFIRSYAKQVGLEEEFIIKKYRLAKEGKSIVTTPEKLIDENNEKVEDKKVVFTSEYVKTPAHENKKAAKFDIRFIYLGAAVVIITLLVYILVLNDSSNTIIKESVKTSSGNETEILDTVERFEIIDPLKENKISAASGDSLFLEVKAVSKTWIRATLDGVIQAEFTLTKDESRILKAKDLFKLLIGNSGGTSLKLNGQDLELRGNVGEIKNIEIDSTGVRYLRMNPDKPNERN